MKMRISVVLVALLALFGAGASAAGQQTLTTFGAQKVEKPVSQGLILPDAQQLSLVEPEPLILTYHNGPVMAGINDTINVFAIYYGNFEPKQRQTLRAFLRSVYKAKKGSSRPTVGKWWEMTKLYVDLYNESVASNLNYAGERFVGYPLGKSLQRTDLATLVKENLGYFRGDARSLYLVLSAADVYVEEFCSICGTHFYTFPSEETKSQMIPYAWIGNSATQCPGYCSWPYTDPSGTPSKTYLPPNGDAGIDGMIIIIANLLAGTATNPYGNAYFQGDAAAPLESAGACVPAFGAGSYSGYPGSLLKDASGTSFNVYGVRGFKFLVPWIWNPSTLACAGQV